MQLLLFSTDSFFLSYYPHTGNHCTCQSFSVVSDVKSSLVTKGDEWGSYTPPFCFAKIMNICKGVLCYFFKEQL